MAVALARIRMPLVWGSIVFVVVGAMVGVLWWLPLVVLVAALAIYFRIGTVRKPPIGVGLPVVGRWKAFNGPADKVPSHRPPSTPASERL